MSILINWTNPSQPADNILVYRATAPFDGSNLPAAMATLPATDVAYEDTTNLLNVVYYYRIARAIGNDVVLSKQLALSERANMGPGSNELVRGDYDTGYFGDVTAEELFTTAGLSTELSYTSGTVVSAAANPTWRKFIHDGKIKFIPNMGLRVSIGNWNTLYSQGLVYGSDDVGAHAALTPVLQNRRVSKDGYTYKVRTIKVHSKASQEIPGGVSKNTVPDSEFAELITRILSNTSGESRWNDRNKLLSTPLSAMVPSQIAHMAGLNGVNGYAISASLVTANGHSSVSSQMAWLPVLELED